jgi:hypothetical protein
MACREHATSCVGALSLRVDVSCARSLNVAWRRRTTIAQIFLDTESRGRHYGYGASQHRVEPSARATPHDHGPNL